jgi:hypothetical protein
LKERKVGKKVGLEEVKKKRVKSPGQGQRSGKKENGGRGVVEGRLIYRLHAVAIRRSSYDNHHCQDRESHVMLHCEPM